MPDERTMVLKCQDSSYLYTLTYLFLLEHLTTVTTKALSTDTMETSFLFATVLHLLDSFVDELVSERGESLYRGNQLCCDHQSFLQSKILDWSLIQSRKSINLQSKKGCVLFLSAVSKCVSAVGQETHFSAGQCHIS